MGKTNKLKKILKVIFCVCICVFLLLGIITLVSLFILDGVSRGENTEPTISYQFFMPDREANILEDENYLQKDLIITYTRGAETFPLAEQNVTELGYGAGFFLDYFDAVIGADEEKLNGLYTDEFIDAHGRTEGFTMQRLYDMNVRYNGEINVKDYDYDKAYVYIVTYKIMRNDGTFRRDIGSDASREQIFYIVPGTDGYKLLDIKYYINNE